MKIVSGFSRLNEIKNLITLGAVEVYCGIKTRCGPINHRLNNSIYNISINELENAIRLTHDYGKKIHLAVNEKGYSEKQLGYIERLVTYAVLLNIDGFIVADIATMQIIASMNSKAKIILSCLNPCFNTESIRFNKQFGISRVIFPRHTTPEEIKEISKNVAIEKEVFFNEVAYCNNIDAFCKMHRGPGNSACECHKNIRTLKGKKRLRARLKKNLNKNLFLNSFTALYNFFNIGIDYIKLGHRDGPACEKYANTKFLAILLEILKEHKINKKDFIKIADRIWKKL